MELEKMALCTREEFEQELNKLCPEPTDNMDPGEYDAILEERVKIRRSITRLRIEALLDGKLTVDQVVNQEHDEDHDIDGIHRDILKKALKEFNEGKIRNGIIEETFNALELL